MLLIEYLIKQKKSFKEYIIDDDDFYMRYFNKDFDEFINLHGFKDTREYQPEKLYNDTVIIFRKK